MMNSTELLSSLVEAVERSGADIAPTYHEYMPMAFGIANSCGEQGRALFHRLCAPSPRYIAKEADRLFDNALRSGRNDNSLGTVWHLAERAGVDLKGIAQPQDISANPADAGRNPCTATGHSSTTYGVSSVSATSAGSPYTRVRASDAEEREDESIILNRLNQPADVRPLAYPAYAWPPFLQQGIDCGETLAQRDILFLAMLAQYGEMLSPILHFRYSHRTFYPCLQMFVIAPPASGKGVLGWVRHLGLPFHEEMMRNFRQQKRAYEAALMEWTNLGKQRTRDNQPEEPLLKMHFVTGDNTGTGILENLINNEGKGVILEAEADLLSAAIHSDYGNWSHTLRKAFDHDGLAYNRRSNREYRECRQSLLSVILSGTPGQLQPFIPDTENGLFSRQIFYYMPSTHGWKDQFDEADTDYAQCFRTWGERWKRFIEPLQRHITSIRFTLTAEQRTAFNVKLEAIYQHGVVIYGDKMAGIVARIAINLLRLASVVAFFRAVTPMLADPEDDADEDFTRRLLRCEGLLPEAGIPQDNLLDCIVSRLDLLILADDFEAVMALAEPIYRHAAYILLFLKEEDTPRRQLGKRDEFLTRLPLEFTRKTMMELGADEGLSESICDKMLGSLLKSGILMKTDRACYRFITRDNASI